MMDFRNNPLLRLIALTVLFFFSWTFLGIYNLAYAIDKQLSQLSLNQPKEQRPEEKLQKNIEDITQAIERVKKAKTHEELQVEKEKLRQKRNEIEGHDAEIRKQFQETEEKIKGLPDEIKQRHKDFVKKYEENLNILRRNLDEIEKAETAEEVKVEVEKVKTFLEKTKPPSKHKPLDPNKLPHRTPEPVKKEPRLNYSSQYPVDSRQEFGVGSKEKADNSSPITRHASPILVASIGDLQGILTNAATQALPPPTQADLSETIEVKFTDEIREVAGLLNNDPVLIYEFVKNNFKFEPYYGSLKGAQQTLLEQAGNDLDQASLLIALYRSIGIPARYVYGTIQLPIDKAISWVGAPDALTAIKIFATNGIPVAKNPDGIATDLQIEHAWIEVFLPYANYRGKINAAGSGSGTWIPLDPSFKQHFSSPSGINLFQASNINVETILQSYLNEVKTALPVREYLSLIKTTIEQAIPDKRFYDLIWTNYIDNKELGLLPSTLEYDVIVTGYKTSEIMDALRHKISFNTTGTLLEEGLSYTTNLSEIAGKRITLSYMPATTIDEETAKQYGNIYDTPPYLIQVKPVLKIDGQVKATGGAIGMAASHELRQTLLMPNGKVEDVVTTAIIAGAYYAIGLNPQRTPAKTLYQRSDRYLQTLGTATATTDKDEIVGEFLNLLITGYLEQKDISNKFIAHTMQFKDFKKTTIAVLGVDLSISYFLGIPIKSDVGQLFLDVKRDVSNPIDMSGEGRTIKDFMIMDGMNGSFLESSIFETVFEVDGVSTLKALGLANLSGIPVYKITPDNASAFLPLLQISADVKTDIVNALNQGLQATVSQREIQLNDWKGVGYIIENPQTGEAAYLISGGLAGGSLTGVIANVKSMIKTGSMTQTEALPYIINLVKKRQIAIPHPLRGSGEIISGWDPARKNPVTGKIKPHNGIDIAVKIGTPVIAVADGIADVRDYSDYGKFILLSHYHSSGLVVYTLYAHLSEFKVNHGASVKEGDVIALSGNTGSSTGPHLHFSVIMTDIFEDWNKFESSIDPQWFVGIQ